MEIEAELGSDKEENDDIVKEIDVSNLRRKISISQRNAEDENDDDLDQDLAELIDYAYNDDGEYKF